LVLQLDLLNIIIESSSTALVALPTEGGQTYQRFQAPDKLLEMLKGRKISKIMWSGSRVNAVATVMLLPQTPHIN
jgi:hypothetical protein